MKYCLFFFLIFCAFKNCSAQVDPTSLFNQRQIANWNGTYINVGQYRVKGSPYLLGQSFPGSITYKNGQSVKDKNLFYNIYDQKAGIDMNGQLFEATEPVDEFTIVLPEMFGGQVLVFKNSTAYGNLGSVHYLNILEDGEKLSLVKQYKSRLVPDPTNSIAKDWRVFEQYYEYFLYLKTTKELNKIKLREKEIFKQLGDEDHVKTFIKANEIDVSKEADLIRLIYNYNRSFRSSGN